MRKTCLHLGCGKVYLKSNNAVKWINIDFEQKGSLKLSNFSNEQQEDFIKRNGTIFHKYYKFSPSDYANLPIIVDKFDDARELKSCEENSIEEIVAFHILEHFTYEDGLKALKRWSSLLVKKGKLHLMVPDVKEICARIIGNRSTGYYSDEHCYRLLYGSNNRNAFLDGHSSGYSVEMIARILQNLNMTWEVHDTFTDNKFNPSIYIIGGR